MSGLEKFICSITERENSKPKRAILLQVVYLLRARARWVIVAVLNFDLGRQGPLYEKSPPSPSELAHSMPRLLIAVFGQRLSLSWSLDCVLTVPLSSTQTGEQREWTGQLLLLCCDSRCTWRHQGWLECGFSGHTQLHSAYPGGIPILLTVSFCKLHASAVKKRGRKSNPPPPMWKNLK